VREAKSPLSLVLVLLAAACADPGGIATTAHAVDPATLETAKTLAAAPVAALEPAWWKRYGDPQLDALVDEAIAGNPSIGVVRARVEQAQAATASARLALTPSTTASIDSTRERLSEHGLVPPPFGGMWIWQNQAMVDLRYAFDLWGKNRKAYEAAVGELHAAQMDAQAARLLLETSVARAYIQLQAAFDQRDVAQATVEQRERILELTRQRFDAGLDSRVALYQAEGAVPSARDQVVAAEQAIALARHQLAALVGRGPDRALAIPRPMLAPIDVALPSRLPADLVGRRPDVAAQRLRIEAAASRIHSAKAAFYPDVDLTAFAGLQALDFERFLRPGSLTVGVGPAVRLPFFERGSLRAGLEARSADWDLAVAQYNQAIVDAVREVVDQYVTLRTLDARKIQVAQALRAAQLAQDVSIERYRAGLGNYLEVLAAEQQVLAQRALEAELRARRLDADVALIRALGGGYDGAAPAHASR